MSLLRGGLWGNADFVKLWTGKIVSDLGSQVTGTALPLAAVLVLKASPTQMGLLVALEALPVLLLGLPVGVWVDRLRRRPVMIAADLGRAVLLATIPVAAVLGALSMGQVYVVAVLGSALTLFFNVADQSFLPTLLRRDQLVEGNSKLGASNSLAEIAGPSLGGGLTQLLTAPIAILFDAISFLVSAAYVAMIRTPEPPPGAREGRQGLWKETGEGLRVVLGSPLLRALAGSAGTMEFFGSFFGTLYLLYVVRELGIAPGVAGLLIGIGGVGALVGAVLTTSVTRRFGVGRTLAGSLVFAAVLQFSVPLVHGPVGLVTAILAVTHLMGDTGYAIYFINGVSLRQSAVPGRYLARANASMQFLVSGLAPVGGLAGGMLGEAIGMRLTLLVAVFGILAASLWLVFSPVLGLQSVEQGSAIERREGD